MEGAENKETAPTTEKRKENVIPKGLPKSGRLWKDENVKKFSSLAYEGSEQLKKTWERKQKEREARKRMKAFEKQIVEERKEAKREARKAREERQRRKKQNELRSTQVQVLADPSKLKTMSKKQLRLIKKSRMTASGEIEYVSPYAK